MRIVVVVLLSAGCGIPEGRFEREYTERFQAAEGRCSGDPTPGAALEGEGCSYDPRVAVDCLDGLDAINGSDCVDAVGSPGAFDLPAACEDVYVCE